MSVNVVAQRGMDIWPPLPHSPTFNINFQAVLHFLVLFLDASLAL